MATRHENCGRLSILKDERGATILMALLALLVAAMVSAVILAAATSTVKQEKSDTEFQQCQLDLQSAGQFALHDIVGADENNDSKVGGGTIVTVTETKTGDAGGNEQWSDPSDPVASGGGDFYQQALRDAVDAIHYGGGTVVNRTYTANLPDITLSKKATGTSGSSGFDTRTVKASLTVRPATTTNGVPSDDYAYIFEFISENSVQGGNANKGKAQVLYLRLLEVAGKPELSSDGKTRVTTYSWKFDRFYTAEGKDDAN